MIMIDRKTALMCAALIALMLVAAVAQLIFVHGPPSPSNQEAPLLWQLYQIFTHLFSLPFVAALMVANLHANGRRAIAIDTRVRPRLELGKRLSIGLCSCILLMQGLQILITLDLQVPVPALAAVAWAVVLYMVVAVLRTINQMPKLPWFEGRLFPAGELGPIYGPRYVRAHARIWIVCVMAAIAGFLALPMRAWFWIPLAFPAVLLWTMALQRHYRRKWKLEQSAASGVKP